MSIREARVGDILTLQRRPVVLEPFKAYQEIGIRSFGKGIFHKEPVSGDQLGDKRVFEVRPGELVLSNVFAWEGAIAVSSESDLGLIGSHRFLTYGASAYEADVSYLRFYFLSRPGLRLIRFASPGAAGRNKTLGIKAFENLRIPLPPVGEQRRIARRLERFQEERKINLERSVRANQLVRALHESLFQASGPVVRVGEYLRLVRQPVSIDASRVYRQIGIYSFGKGIILREPAPGAELNTLRYFEIPRDALVVSNIQAWEGAIAFSGKEACNTIGSNRFLSYLPRSGDADANYFRYFFLSRRGQLLIQKASPGTMVRNRTLGIHSFEDLRIPLPDIVEQRRIARLLDCAYGVLQRTHERQGSFENLIAAALHDAFGWAEERHGFTSSRE